MSRRSFLKQSLAMMLALHLPGQAVLEMPAWQIAQGSETRYDVILSKVGEKRVDVLRAVRELSGISLEAALWVLAQPGRTLLRGWSPPAVEIAKKRLEGLGATVQVVESPFLLWVEDVFGIRNRGVVVTGTVARGIIKTYDTVELVGLRPQALRATVTGIEMNHVLFDYAKCGDKVGLLLEGVERNQVARGTAVAQPWTLRLNTSYPVELYVLRREEGGKHLAVFNGYRPQFRASFNDITGTIHLPEAIEMLLPGNALRVNVEMSVPCAFEPGTWLEMRDGGVVTGIAYLLTVPPLWMLLP